MVIGFNQQFVEPILSGSKIHTIREDKTNRWSPGKIMHMATGVRTKQYKEFNLESGYESMLTYYLKIAPFLHEPPCT